MLYLEVIFYLRYRETKSVGIFVSSISFTMFHLSRNLFNPLNIITNTIH